MMYSTGSTGSWDDKMAILPVLWAKIWRHGEFGETLWWYDGIQQNMVARSRLESPQVIVVFAHDNC